MIEWHAPFRWLFYAGPDMRSERRVIAFCWGWRPEAAEGEEAWCHIWTIHAPSWPLIYYRDADGRVWPCGYMVFGHCRMWRWHLP